MSKKKLSMSSKEQPVFSFKIFWIALMALGLIGCEDGSNEIEVLEDEQAIVNDTPLVFIQRATSELASASQFEALSSVGNQSRRFAQETPADVQPGAKLILQDTLDVESERVDLLADFLGTQAYDVKDLEVSADGNRFLFAAHGAGVPGDAHSSWNIYEYDTLSGELRRVIEDDSIANQGQDTDPAYDSLGNIVFSTDRSGAVPLPANGDVFTQNGESCVALETRKPFLLHRMTERGENIEQLTYGVHRDVQPNGLSDGRVSFTRITDIYERVPECDADPMMASLIGGAQGEAIASTDLAGVEGVVRPAGWSVQQICRSAQETPIGAVITGRKYQLLRLDITTGLLEQLYDDVIMQSSDELFLTIDEIVQGENGKFNQALLNLIVRGAQT